MQTQSLNRFKRFINKKLKLRHLSSSSVSPKNEWMRGREGRQAGRQADNAEKIERLN